MEPFIITLIFFASTCWGSFLAATAYRIAFDKPFLKKRSSCPHCQSIISWYDNIPLISWIILRGSCRTCNQPISIVYPLTELITGLSFTTLLLKELPLENHHTLIIKGSIIATYWQHYYDYYQLISVVACLFFFSALIIAIATDLFAMVIPQIVTLWFIPIGMVFAYTNIINITLIESILGTLLGYGILWSVAVVFKRLTKKDGLGIGDMEQLAMIGAFLGPEGTWYTLMLGSLSGAIIGSLYLKITKQQSSTRIPFGPFLNIGAMIYFLFLLK